MPHYARWAITISSVLILAACQPDTNDPGNKVASLAQASTEAAPREPQSSVGYGPAGDNVQGLKPNDRRYRTYE